MRVTLGKEGLEKTWQNEFGKEVKCDCGGKSRIAFVAHEGLTTEDSHQPRIYEMHKNKKGSMWTHDRCAVAVYLCKKCLKPTAVMNQG